MGTKAVPSENMTLSVFDLEQFIDDISANNADKHIVDYYENKVGTYKNINFSDGPKGQGSI
jgi:hypothetical protein